MKWVVGVSLSLGLGFSLSGAEPPPCSKEIAAFSRNSGSERVKYNSILQTPSLEHGAISFNAIRESDFPSAILHGLREARLRVDAIRNNPAAPDFANTIAALEAVGEPLDQPVSLFGHWKSLRNGATIERQAARLDPILSRFSGSLYTDEKLFARVEAVYAMKDKLGLDAEAKVLLEHTYRAFVKSGAKLGSVDKKRIIDIHSELTTLAEKFKKNVSDSTNGYVMNLTDASELKGLPDSAIAAAAEAAAKRKLTGWVFTLQAPSVMPFLTYANSRGRRQELWKAYASRAVGGKNDNSPIMVQIAKLRAESAKLLGFASHADLVMSDRMARNASTVDRFLADLATVYRPHAEKDLAEVQALAPFPLETWDWAYYSEKLKEQKFNYKAEVLRPYFRIGKVLEGAFFAANKLYGVTFKPRTDLPTWDDSVKAFEVSDRDGKFLALFYMDPYPREPKRQGAWMNDIRGAGRFNGQLRRPHVVNAGNLTPPVGGAEALLTLDDVVTIFHELGHGLHSMLTRVKTASLAGTNVAWDFVELPSQFFENWAFEPEVLDVYARHKDTGERIPADLIARVRNAERFQAGYRGLRQVMLARIDLAWHTGDLSGLRAEGVEAFEESMTAPFRILPRAKGVSTSATFSHIFAGGYAGGYYSYKWAEVLAADAFELFKQKGVFDAESADRFRKAVLERGGSAEADELYRQFRGANPDPAALPRSEGLVGRN